MKKLSIVALVATLFISTMVSAGNKNSVSQKEIAALRAQIKTLTAGNA